MTNEQWAGHLRAVQPILATLAVTPKEIYEHEGSNQVTVWATSDAKFREEAKGEDGGLEWRYCGEYVFILFFEEAGDRIERVVEFMDSKRVVEMRGLMEIGKRNVMAWREKSWGGQQGTVLKA